MSKKQQEMLDAQLVSERRIRDEMLALNALVYKTTSIVSRAIEACPLDVKARLGRMMRTFTRLLRSPLAAPYIVDVVKLVTRKVFHDCEEPHCAIVVSFYDAVVYCTLRLVDAPVQIESVWRQEPLDKAYKRMVASLKDEFAKDYDDFDLDLAKLAFLYPFLKVCLNAAKQLFSPKILNYQVYIGTSVHRRDLFERPDRDCIEILDVPKQYPKRSSRRAQVARLLS